MIERLYVNGVELSLMQLAPPADQSPASTVVMLHGLVLGSMASWYSAFALPLAKSHRVLLFDLRGHGDSGAAQSGFDLDTLASDLAGVLAARAPQPDFNPCVPQPGIDSCVPHGGKVDLVGHSVGALVALRFAIRHPGRVNRLVLVDAPMPAAEYVAPSFAGVTDPASVAAFLDAHAGALGGRRRAKLQERLQRLFFDSSLAADVAQMHAEPLADLQRLTAPTLLVYGDASPCRAAGEGLRDALPDARLDLVAGGHYLPEEAPAALLAAIQNFFAATDAATPA